MIDTESTIHDTEYYTILTIKSILHTTLLTIPQNYSHYHHCLFILVYSNSYGVHISLQGLIRWVGFISYKDSWPIIGLTYIINGVETWELLKCIPAVLWLRPRALGIHFRQTTCAHVTTITYTLVPVHISC